MNDERLFLLASQEFDTNRRPETWAKALALSGNDAGKARGAYLMLRVESLRRDLRRARVVSWLRWNLEGLVFGGLLTLSLIVVFYIRSSHDGSIVKGLQLHPGRYLSDAFWTFLGVAIVFALGSVAVNLQKQSEKRAKRKQRLARIRQEKGSA